MTEPKHIPLAARLATDFAAFVDERATRLAETVAAAWEGIDAALVRVLRVPDEALIEAEDDPTEEEYR